MARRAISLVELENPELAKSWALWLSTRDETPEDSR